PYHLELAGTLGANLADDKERPAVKHEAGGEQTDDAGDDVVGVFAGKSNDRHVLKRQARLEGRNLFEGGGHLLALRAVGREDAVNAARRHPHVTALRRAEEAEARIESVEQS